jgi:hypothetical protein
MKSEQRERRAGVYPGQLLVQKKVAVGRLNRLANPRNLDDLSTLAAIREISLPSNPSSERFAKPIVTGRQVHLSQVLVTDRAPKRTGPESERAQDSWKCFGGIAPGKVRGGVGVYNCCRIRCSKRTPPTISQQEGLWLLFAINAQKATSVLLSLLPTQERNIPRREILGAQSFVAYGGIAFQSQTNSAHVETAKPHAEDYL